MRSDEGVRFATIWLSGCAGCHMSFLDQDELLLELAKKVLVVYSPLVDEKEFPDEVDVTIVEGAVGNEEQLALIRKARASTGILISMGDCAVTGNVTALRNAWENGDEAVLRRAYLELVETAPQIPNEVPALLKKAYPLHEVVKVDYFIPGCPPDASRINYVLTELLEGREPEMEGRSKFG
ncbi:MAG: oxidoreductase [Methanomassiliicoccales archaeon]|nr:oxidoreductase [Methanomassiliicoccales archaeon]NYT14618.1 oxidoreductase [Methanomassiliicoccales archaeon]